MEGAYVAALYYRWPDLEGPLRRAGADSEVLRPLKSRLEALQQDDDAREASAMLAAQVLRERLDRKDIGVAERGTLWLERGVWGWATGRRLPRSTPATAAVRPPGSPPLHGLVDRADRERDPARMSQRPCASQHRPRHPAPA